MGKRVEVIVFNGVKFRRYPDAKGLSEQRYYTPGIGDRQRGVKRLHEEIWMHTHGKSIPEGHHIHHSDGDHNNNAPGNLVCITADEHLAHHARLTDYRTPWRLAHLDSVRPLASAWHRSDAGRAWHSEHGKRTWEGREAITKTCDQCSTNYSTRSRGPEDRFCSNACKSAWRRASGVDDVPRECGFCGDTFHANKYSRTRYCGRSCARRDRSARASSRLEHHGR